MSIDLRTAVMSGTLLLLLLLHVGVQASGGADVRVRLETGERPKAFVTADLPETGAAKRRSLSFITEHAGVKELDSRISGLKTFAADGTEIPNRPAGSGVYFTDAGISSVSYVVDLKLQNDPTLGAHVSWFGCGTGALMLLDLLPSEALEAGRLAISFTPPDGAYVSGPPEHDKSGIVEVPGDAVFTILPHSTRRYFASSPGIDFKVSVTGEWQFTEAGLVKMTSDLLKEYEDLFGSGPGEEVSVNMIPVPCSDLRGRWRAETRGRTVLILSSPAPYKNLGEQLAHEQLRHELLHLWIPNRLDLEGDYAWFYEGFVFYRALITGVQLGQIRFEDVLSTLADVRRRAVARPWRPLAGSAGDRWAEGSGQWHSQAVLTAFAADVLIGARDGGIDRLLKDVFRVALELDRPADGGSFVISRMERRPELRLLVENSLKGETAPNWEMLIELAGLNGAGPRSGLSPVSKPTSRQKAFLRRLGYNGRR